MIDVANEYEAAAEAMAEAGFLKNPVEMAKRFMPLSPEALVAIEADELAFARRVNDYAYGRAMEDKS